MTRYRHKEGFDSEISHVETDDSGDPATAILVMKDGRIELAATVWDLAAIKFCIETGVWVRMREAAQAEGMIAEMTYSHLHKSKIRHQWEVNGTWVTEVESDVGRHDTGTMVSEAAPPGTDDSLCFTAPNGKRYMDTPKHTTWRVRK